jgi:DNA-directed RNA polymerase alpha subunit
VFILLEAFCEDEQLKSKTLTVLKRMGATEAEELLKVDEKQIKKARNCGPKMQELIFKIKEEIQNKHISVN